MFGLKAGQVIHILIHDDPQVVRLLMHRNIICRKDLSHCRQRYQVGSLFNPDVEQIGVSSNESSNTGEVTTENMVGNTVKCHR